MDMMDISGSLKLDLMAGLIKLQGSGSYANTESSSARTLSVTLKSSKTSVTHILQSDVIQQPSYTDIVSNATHVVTGIPSA